MSKPTHIINTQTGAVFIYTKALADVPGMALCDKDGKVIVGASAETAGLQTPPTPPEPPAGNVPLMLEDYKVLLEKMERAELTAKATDLGVEFAPNIGDAKLRKRILAAVEARLGSGDADGDEE